MGDEERGLERIRKRVAERRAELAEDAPGEPDVAEEPGVGDRADGEGPEPDRPSGSRGDALRDRVADVPGSVRSTLGRVAGTVGSATGWLGRAWFAIPLAIRQRVAAVAALGAIVAVVMLVLVPLAPCWVPGGDRCPPDDDAIALVPADSSAYLHANLDAGTDEFEAAAAIAERLPVLTEAGVSVLPGLSLEELDYDREIRPWSGGELAVVLEPTAAGIERLLMLEADDADAALEYGEGLLGRGARDIEIDDVSARVDEDGLAVALTGGFLLVGEESRVAETIRIAAGEGESLDSDSAAALARGRLPESRVADLYLSGALVRRLSVDEQLSAFDTFVNSSSSEGVAASLSVDEGGFDLVVRSSLDPGSSADDGDFFSALEPFEPMLQEDIRSDALAYLGVGDPAAGAATLIGRAAETAPELFAGLERLSARLRRRDGIRIEQRVLPLLEGEAALTIEPQTGGGAGPEAEVAGPSTPYLGLLATEVGEGASRELAELQAPIVGAIDPGSGQAPVFETREIAGVEAQSLRLSPVVDLTYASFDDRLVVGTSPAAVERARSDGPWLADDERFEELTEDMSELSSLFLYLDLAGLVDLGEALFLAEDPEYARVAADVRQLDAAAMSVTRGEEALDTDLRVTVGEPEAAAAAEGLAP